MRVQFRTLLVAVIAGLVLSAQAFAMHVHVDAVDDCVLCVHADGQPVADRLEQRTHSEPRAARDWPTPLSLAADSQKRAPYLPRAPPR